MVRFSIFWRVASRLGVFFLAVGLGRNILIKTSIPIVRHVVHAVPEAAEEGEARRQLARFGSPGKDAVSLVIAVLNLFQSDVEVSVSWYRSVIC